MLEPHPPIGMYTHERRAELAADTVQHFARAGLQVSHAQVQTTPPSAARNRLNARACLAALSDQHRHHAGALLIEDDIVPNQHLRAWLEHLNATAQHVTTLYTGGRTWERLTPPRLHRLMSGRPPRAETGEIIETHNLRGWWGAQALWLPWRWIDALLTDPRLTLEETGPGSFDTTLRLLLIEAGEPLLVTAPNIVQHRAPPNLTAPYRAAHRSMSYDAATRPPPRHPDQPAREGATRCKVGAD